VQSEGFPQVYLGLLLTAEKLKLEHFTPLIARVDKYLSGWAALLLSAGGRIVLLNAVLDALPTFAMGAVQLPTPPPPGDRGIAACFPLEHQGPAEWGKVPCRLGHGLQIEGRRRLGDQVPRGEERVLAS
jgi:hypothetical protein